MIKIGAVIGAFNTILATLLTAAAGIYFVRLQGISTLYSALNTIKNEQPPLKELFKNFEGVIKDRNSKKISSEMTFIGIKETKILDIDNKDTFYKVKTKFVSEIVNCLKDDKGEVLEGNPEEIKLVTDVWVFEKDLKNSDPTWYLTELSSEEETKH